MTQRAEDLELFHFGVKGMKWGVRRKSDKSSTKSGPGKLSKAVTGIDDKITSTVIKKNNKTIKTLKKGTSSEATLEDSYRAGKQLTVSEILRSGGPNRAAKAKVTELSNENEKLRTGKATVSERINAYSKLTPSDFFE